MTNKGNSKITNNQSNYLFQETKDKFKNNNEYKNSYKNNYKNYNNYHSKNFYNNSNYSNYNKRYDNNNNREAFTRKSIVKCDYCNREGHSENQCRIKMDLCFKCGGPNHLAKSCRQNKRRNLNNNRFNSYDRYINQNKTTKFKETGIQTASNDHEWEDNYIIPTPEGGLTPLNMHAST